MWSNMLPRGKEEKGKQGCQCPRTKKKKKSFGMRMKLRKLYKAEMRKRSL